MIHRLTFPISLLLSLACVCPMWGVLVTNPDIEGVGGLRQALDGINASPLAINQIDIQLAAANLTGQIYNLPPIDIQTNALIINGPLGDAFLIGGNTFRGFFISSGNVTINNMTLNNNQAQGGDGGSGGGGGGLGAGGAFFVKSGASLTLNGVSVTSAIAAGGNGGDGNSLAGGGGGMGGAGGAGNTSGGSGGGLFGAGRDGDSEGGGSGGGGLFGAGGIAGGTSFPDRSGGGGGGELPVTGNGEDGDTNLGGNGGGGDGTTGLGGFQTGNILPSGQNGGQNTGGGGGVGGTVSFGSGGNGGYNGGGGGGGASDVGGDLSGGDGGEYGGGGSAGVGVVFGAAGRGGFSGGGAGASANATPNAGGIGGFGGGAGSSINSYGANGGFGGGGSVNVVFNADVDFSGGLGGAYAGNGGAGGSDGTAGGGGGAGLGGAIFIHSGGAVTIQDGTTFVDSTVLGGSGGAPSSSSESGSPGQALGLDIFMMASSQLTFDVVDALELSTDIIGDAGVGGGSLSIGGVTKTNSGIVTLGGTNTYSGFTNVNFGTLVINGSTLTQTIVRSGGILKGNGTIFNLVNVQNGGTIFPGNSSAILNVSSLQLDPLSQIIIEANDSGASSLIEVSGTAQVNGSLQVNFSPGNYQVGQLFTIIDSEAGVLGQFSSTQTSLGIDYQTIYNPNSIQIVIGTEIPPPVPPLFPCTFNSDIPLIHPEISLNGIRDNARRVGNYLNSINTQTFIQPQIEALGELSTEQLSDALKSISPGRNAFSTYVAQDAMFWINKVTTTRMSIQRALHSLGHRDANVAGLFQESLDVSEGLLVDARSDKPLPRGSVKQAGAGKNEYILWASGLADYMHQNKQRQNPAFSATVEGGLLGFETYKFSNILFGATAGYAHSQIDMAQKTGSSQANYYFMGIYQTTYIGNGYIEFALWGTYNRYKEKRHISYPGFYETAHSSHTGWQLTPSLSIGYDATFKWGLIEPFASLDAVIGFEQGFTEHKAAPYNITQSSHTSEFLRFETGINGYEIWNKKWGSFILRETLSYVLRKPYHVGTVTAAIVGAPGNFTVYSFTKTQNILSPGAEVFFKHKRGGFASVNYSGEFGFGSGYLSNEVIGKIGVYF